VLSNGALSLTEVAMNHAEARADLAAAFRLTARENMHEGVANHFSLAVNEDGTEFLINPKKHFSRIRASDLWVIDADDPDSAKGEDAPDQTAWGLHASLHRHVPHARCAMHVHSTYATVLACLADSRLPPIDQSSAMFYNRQVVDTDYGGLALEEEGTRCARLFQDPSVRTMIMGNHGVLFIGETVAETFTRTKALSSWQKTPGESEGRGQRPHSRERTPRRRFRRRRNPP
jgi:ribulose-5-phosphate 4-epimerase/fuculose-1-phosphate aldolase